MLKTLLSLSVVTLLPVTVSAAEPSFFDVPSDHPAFDAVEFLKGKGIIQGFPDSSFRPDKRLSRSEAVKLVVAPSVSTNQLQEASRSPSVYLDVSIGDWYWPYLELARRGGIIDGPPKKTNFFPEKTVLTSEFLKMVIESFGIDETAYSEIHLPLSPEVTDTGAWFYPFIRYAVASSMIRANDEGELDPDRQLTRADAAIILQHLLLYQNGERSDDLLEYTLTDAVAVLEFLEAERLLDAEHTSARALLASRGAHSMSPTEPKYQGAVKTAEALRALVRAYRAASEGAHEEAINLATDAWHLGNRAREFSSAHSGVASEIQDAAETLADRERNLSP